MASLSVAESTVQYRDGATATKVPGADVDSKLDALAAQRGGGTYQMDPATQRLGEVRGADANRVLDQMSHLAASTAQDLAQRQAMEALRSMGIGGTQPDRAQTPTPSTPAQSATHKPGHAPVASSHVAALASRVDLSSVQRAAQGEGSHALAVQANKGSQTHRR